MEEDWAGKILPFALLHVVPVGSGLVPFSNGQA